MKHLPRLTIFWAIKQISINLKVFKSYKVCFLRCQVAQSCPAVCDSMDYSPPGSSVHEILQAKILESVAISSFRGSSNLGIKSTSLMFPTLSGGLFTAGATWEAPSMAITLVTWCFSYKHCEPHKWPSFPFHISFYNTWGYMCGQLLALYRLHFSSLIYGICFISTLILFLFCMSFNLYLFVLIWSYKPSSNLPGAKWGSVQFSCSVVSNSLWPHGLQHARPPCPSPTPRVHPNPCPLSQWWHPTISSSVSLFSSCSQSFPASGSFPMSQLFASGGQSIGVSASASVLPMNIQNWFHLGWTGWIFL